MSGDAAVAAAALRDIQASPLRPSSRSLGNAMKEGLLGGKLRLSPRTNLEEARSQCCMLDWI